MQTTIHKKVKGSVMEQIFDKAETFSVRYFNIPSFDGDFRKYNKNQEYDYEIVIRHPEKTDAEKLFNKAIKQFS